MLFSVNTYNNMCTRGVNITDLTCSCNTLVFTLRLSVMSSFDLLLEIQLFDDLHGSFLGNLDIQGFFVDNRWSKLYIR